MARATKKQLSLRKVLWLELKGHSRAGIILHFKKILSELNVRSIKIAAVISYVVKFLVKIIAGTSRIV